jgi:4-hydroxybenzoate polyprenyltransferase
MKQPAADVSAHGAPAPRSNGVAQTLRAVRIIHPFPTLLNVAATAGLAFVASGGTPAADVLVRMLIVMFLAQSCIGVTNDLFDEELDATAKPWKPLVAGAVTRRTAMWLAVACGTGSMVIAATLGAWSLALAALGLACGLAYDARLKRSALSALPFMVAIPTLPLWVWVTLDEWDPVLWWLLPLGGLIGLSLHLVNTIPDINDDANAGVRGLAHRLGERNAVIVAWASFATALATTIAIAPFVSYQAPLYVATLAGGLLCMAGGIATYIMHSARSLQVGFALLGVGCAGLAVGWLAAVT